MMKSYAFCPVSDKKINEQVARINGAFTVLILLVFSLTQSIIPLIFLVIDFLLRATDYARYSLIGISSQGIVRYLSLGGTTINAGPKLFAARIGFVLSSLIVITFASNALTTALFIAGILGLFSFLEAAFGICVACRIYPYIQRLTERLT